MNTNGAQAVQRAEPIDKKCGRRNTMRIRVRSWLMLGQCVLWIGGLPAQSLAEEMTNDTAESRPSDGSVWDAMVESLTGDVYAEPSRWRALSLGTFFTEGWDEAWVSPPTGEGGAPRQGWLNAFDGVFYRLGIATFGFANGFGGNGDQYTGGLTLYNGLSRRFELRNDIPFFVKNKGAGGDYHSSFGDYTIVPNVLLSETRNVTQLFNVRFRTPTGDVENGNGVSSVTPTYEFWANVWRGMVVRGGFAFEVPYGDQSKDEAGARTTFLGNLAVGYYFTPHDATPFGDLVWYLSTNLKNFMDDRGPNTTTLTFTPGFRTHLGRDWYLLGAVEVPVTDPDPFDYQVLAGLMKVY